MQNTFVPLSHLRGEMRPEPKGKWGWTATSLIDKPLVHNGLHRGMPMSNTKSEYRKLAAVAAAVMPIPTRVVYCAGRRPSDALRPWRATKYNAKGYPVTRYFMHEKTALYWLAR